MEEILKNEELMKKIVGCKTAEELEKVFAENGVALEEGVTAQQFLDTMKGSDDELSADDLDDVSGGVSMRLVALAAAGVGLSLAKYLKKYGRKIAETLVV